MIVTARLLEYDVKNANGRIYTKECAEDIVKQFGELDHPMFGIIDFPEDPDNISFKSISHVIKSVYINEEKKCVEGTLEILDTPKGRILDSNVHAFGGPEEFRENFNIASRGTGKINEKGEVEDFTIFGFDVVSSPKRDTFKIE